MSARVKTAIGAAAFLVALTFMSWTGAAQGAPAAAPQAQAKPADGWTIELPNSYITFTIRHRLVEFARGRFNTWNGTVQLDPANMANSKVEIRIDTASIDTNNKQRDDHLRNPDFFDVQKFPEAVFVSTSVKPGVENRLVIAGNLTMHGVTREVVLDAEHGGWFKDPKGNERTAFTAKTTINRQDYGIKWNSVGADLGGRNTLGDWVDIQLDIVARKSAAPPPQAAVR